MNPFNRLGVVQAAQDACLVKRQRQEHTHEPLTMWTTVSKHNNSSANSSAASLAAPAHKTAAADLLALLGKGSQGSMPPGGRQLPGQQQRQRPLSGNATAQAANLVRQCPPAAPLLRLPSAAPPVSGQPGNRGSAVASTNGQLSSHSRGMQQGRPQTTYAGTTNGGGTRSTSSRHRGAGRGSSSSRSKAGPQLEAAPLLVLGMGSAPKRPKTGRAPTCVAPTEYFDHWDDGAGSWVS